MSFLNLSGVKEEGFDVVPAGKYVVRCNKAEVVDTKKGDGRYIKCQFKIDDGEYEGKAIFHNFNIENPNDKAVQIGLGQLKSFLKSSGYHNPEELSSVSDLEGLKAMANVKIRSSEQYGDSNDISSFSKIKQEDKDKIPF